MKTTVVSRGKQVVINGEVTQSDFSLLRSFIGDVWQMGRKDKALEKGDQLEDNQNDCVKRL